MSTTSRNYSRRLVVGAGIFFAAFLSIQFVRPELRSSPAADSSADEPVKQILRNGCYNCHSNQTKLAWFDRIAPAYWLVAQHVKQARHVLNFSDFDRLSRAQQRAVLFESVYQIQSGAMPPRSYQFLHPESRVTLQQVEILKHYLSTQAPDQLTSHQDNSHSPSSPIPADVQPALNGIPFVPEYKNWKTISSTDRFDNHTMRLVLGNEVAFSAIASNHVNPWPDGTMLAKVAWEPSADGTGSVSAGKFVQVEFMIKDRKKYASTKGWGFARWKGTDLQPYGKSAGFAAECVGCHAPMRGNDFVFTKPIESARGKDSDSLPFDPFQWKVISSSIDVQGGTMATLYGNDLAVDSARCGSQSKYPPGAILALVTWFQQDDSHWFGARIPGPIKSVEFVTASRSYQEFRGTPLKRTMTSARLVDSRIDYILGQRASVMP